MQNLLRFDGQQWNYGEVKFPSNLKAGKKPLVKWAPAPYPRTHFIGGIGGLIYTCMPSRESQGSFCVCAQPIRDEFTMQCHHPLAGRIHKMVPGIMRWKQLFWGMCVCIEYLVYGGFIIAMNLSLVIWNYAVKFSYLLLSVCLRALIFSSVMTMMQILTVNTFDLIKIVESRWMLL